MQNMLSPNNWNWEKQKKPLPLWAWVWNRTIFGGQQHLSKICMQQVVLKYEEEAQWNERGTKTVDVAHFGMIDVSYFEKNAHKYR